jgi:hypothetical protein
LLKSILESVSVSVPTSVKPPWSTCMILSLLGKVPMKWGRYGALLVDTNNSHLAHGPRHVETISTWAVMARSILHSLL